SVESLLTEEVRSLSEILSLKPLLKPQFENPKVPLLVVWNQKKPLSSVTGTRISSKQRLWIYSEGVYQSSRGVLPLQSMAEKASFDQTVLVSCNQGRLDSGLLTRTRSL